MKAAATVFSRYGFRQTNMEIIAQEAGLSRQALYRYFPNKESLFTGVVEDLHRAALEAGEAAVVTATREGRGLADVLYAQLDARFGHFMDRLEHSPHTEELTEENTALAADTAARYAELLREAVTRVIRAAITVDGLSLRPGLTPERLAHLVIHASRGLKNARPTPDLDRFRADLRQLVDLLVDGALAAQPDEPARTRRRASAGHR
ncbi:hypothetical protein GCM10023259_008570 [Thermocatellispora tengchongensis]